jgi:hypothetical protein
MSHDLRRRGSCHITIWIPLLHSVNRTIARDVTAKVVGSGALLGIYFVVDCDHKIASELQREIDGIQHVLLAPSDALSRLGG